MIQRIALAAVIATSMVLPAAAQNLFAPVAKVNDSVITEYEVGQRTRFLQLLNAPGATRSASIDALIDDRLRQQAARRAGLELTNEGLNAALTEFAGRANLDQEQFVKALAQSGVSVETFRDFVGVSVLWRDLIRGRYGNRVQISEAEIDRALAASGSSSSIRVLLSEIIIPAPPPQAASAQAKAEQAASATTIAEFSSYARRFSATATRGRGGRLEWVPLNNLPPQLRGVILGLGIGEVSDPLPIPGAIALFQLRDIEESDAPEQDYSAIEYAASYMAGGRSAETLAAAERLKNDVDVCDDLYGFAKGQPEDALDRGALPPAEIPQDIAIELAKLDTGEVSTNLTRNNGQSLVFLMLCGRTAALNEDVGRDAVANQLRQQRLSGFADSLLEQLRADSRISRK
jgi:peptidyl-prolyl cis-trans isomerase SurA